MKNVVISQSHFLAENLAHEDIIYLKEFIWDIGLSLLRSRISEKVGPFYIKYKQLLFIHNFDMNSKSPTYKSTCLQTPDSGLKKALILMSF